MPRKAKLTETQLMLRESIDNQALLRERITELELTLEDEGWRRMAIEGEREFSRGGLSTISKLSRLMFMKNPLINRAVNIQSFYVWARGVSIVGADDATQAVISDFLEDPKNQAELTGHQAQTMKEQDLQVTGNLFFVLFTDESTGRVRVRSIPMDEVIEIIADPDDSKSPWYYKRVWQNKTTSYQTGVLNITQEEAYYPDLHNDDPARPQTINGKTVHWDRPVHHMRIGCLSDMQFGVPEYYQGFDWAKAYSAALEDFATILRALSRFAWKMDTKGGKKAVVSAQNQLGTTLGDAGNFETNPPATVAATWIHSSADMAPMKTAGATTNPADCKPLKMQVCAATGLPETFFGDADVGNHATSKTLDRPTELKFLDRQELWKATFTTILNHVVQSSQSSANGRLFTTSNLPEAKFTITFPPILEHDLAETMTAIVEAATLHGWVEAGTIDPDTLSRLILELLGVKDIEKALADVKVYRADMEKKAADAAKQMQQNPAPAAGPPAASKKAAA